jgi:hypothetical protein
VLEQELHHSCVAILRCKPQRCIAISMHVGAVLEEELHNLSVAVITCQ